MALKIEQFMCRSDNFGILAHDTETGETALIDAPEEGAILAAVERTGWRPTMILTTHHHPDHVEANLALKERFGLSITGPAAEADRIPGIDRTVSEGDTVTVGKQNATVIETPGHTAGHVSYHFSDAGIVFTADTLFALGCGRLFECKPPVMLASLKKLAALPLETVVYCGHEYTEANARFALTVDPTNSALKERAKEISRLRSEGKPTLPTTMGKEMATNPFLRWHDPVIRRNLGMEDASDEAVFAEIRKRKDIS
ncbi:MAG: hydroxyacylglutathione hydrolase [Nitratireductor sp.]|uniref:hydroxyacylglutathione hydrolase n=1 Tax=Nitratireductor sp. B36 TaxID=2762059 RepID=UPI000C94368A|nr:hydroxyacylglutathione hydrolase [Nitratireductor sp. B36]MAS12151.1 hydroxyacylglutathione hydrolase [Nitratireductor sp.]MCC5780470.1 hydroxyacylglutathione hydrolase [Nitratireductor sp. B36]